MTNKSNKFSNMPEIAKQIMVGIALARLFSISDI